MITHLTEFNPEDGCRMLLKHVDIRFLGCTVSVQKTTIWKRSSGKNYSFASFDATRSGWE
jgi:hypothetical protein